MDLQRFVDAIRLARPDGTAIRDWSIYGSRSRKLSLGVKDRETGNAHAPMALAESRGATYVFVWNDGRVSRGYFERRQLETKFEESFACARMAAYDDPDAAYVCGPADFPEVEIHDPRSAKIAHGETELLARRLNRIRETVAECDARTWSASFSASETQAILQTSAGLDVLGHGTGTGWFVSIDGEIGTGFSARAPEPDAEFDSRLDRLVSFASELRREADCAASGVVPVILHPRVVESYVLSTLLHHLDGSTVSHGESRFSRKDFDVARMVFREEIGLGVDPLQPLRNGSYRFTVEGVPAAVCDYLAQGRLASPVLDLKYSRRLALEPTPLPYSMDTLNFTGPPAVETGAAYSRASGGVLVLSVLGVHTQDNASGDFSLSAPQALRVNDGRLDGRVRGTISGNLFDLLNDPALEFVHFTGEHTPGLLFPCRFDPK